MSQISLQDEQWLACLPESLGFGYERFCRNQLDDTGEAKAWFTFDEAINDNIVAFNSAHTALTNSSCAQASVSTMTAVEIICRVSLLVISQFAF